MHQCLPLSVLYKSPPSLPLPAGSSSSSISLCFYMPSHSYTFAYSCHSQSSFIQQAFAIRVQIGMFQSGCSSREDLLSEQAPSRATVREIPVLRTTSSTVPSSHHLLEYKMPSISSYHHGDVQVSLSVCSVDWVNLVFFCVLELSQLENI